MNENYKKLKLSDLKYESFPSYRDPKIRNEIKKSTLQTLEFGNNLPSYVKRECEAILSDIQIWETWEKQGKLKDFYEKNKEN